MKKKAWPMMQMLPQYFTRHLGSEVDASGHTVDTYRHAWRIFLQYLRRDRGVRPEKMDVADLTAADVLTFLTHLETERGNSPSTRNARLSAIRGAVKYAVGIDPTLPFPVHQILSIPRKKTIRKMPESLTRPEVDVLLETPDDSLWTGRRDRIMLETFYNLGARVSEMAGIQVRDVVLGSRPELLLHGKGRKERKVTLWKRTARMHRDWIRQNRLGSNDPLFPSIRGTPMTRSAIAKRLGRIVKSATGRMETLARLKISPHTLRHTTAMHLLQSGVDIAMVSMCLGHESLETTMRYLTEDMESMEKAIEKLQPPKGRLGRYRPDDALLAILEGH